MISVYKRKTQIEAGPRKIEMFAKYEDLVQKGRENPVWFIEKFFDVKLTDYQRWIILSAWTKKTVCLVCSRNTGKSFLAGLYMMARAVLFPSSKIWIMSGTAAQAQDTFTKIEDISKHNITSVKNEKCIFYNEVIKGQTNTDGFIKEKNSYKVRLFNGSTIVTLVGKAESIVGKRSNLSVFDESCIIPDDFFVRAEPFTTQSSDFKTGEGIDVEIFPQALPNQNLYLSSAGDTNSHLWEVYKDCARRMAMGFDDCFVADITCEIPLNPTIDGKPYTPLFERSKVDAMMRTNPYRALREYYNLFDKAGGTDMVISRDAILRNEKNYLPIFKNQNKDSIYGIFFDPALQADNSFVLIGEFWKDPKIGWKGKIINGINLLQILPNGDKKPMRSTEQLEWVHQLMLDYNGDNQEYEKIHLAVDPGSGGGGRIYGDFLIQEWYDTKGKLHHGVIDLTDETYAQEAPKYPLAVPGVVVFPNAVKFKNEQYGAVTEMISADLVEFPPSLPNNGQIEVDGKIYTLTTEEARALLEIDLVKEEVLLMRKTRTESGNIRYALVADSSRKSHDDRAYTLSMFCHFLMQLRREDQFDIEVPTANMAALLGTHTGRGGGGSAKVPAFFGRRNPFGGRKR